MPPIIGIIVNAIACAFATIIFAFSCFPAVTPVNKLTMNYSSVVTGGVMIFSIVYYIVRGRKKYHGPTIEIDD